MDVGCPSLSTIYDGIMEIALEIHLLEILLEILRDWARLIVG